MKGMEHMPTVSGKILSVEEETKLLQPIDSYVNEIQKKVDDLRADGTTRIVELQSSIDATKNDRVLTKACSSVRTARCPWLYLPTSHPSGL